MQIQYREASDKFAALRNSLIDVINEIDILEELKEKQEKEYLKEIQKRKRKIWRKNKLPYLYARWKNVWLARVRKIPVALVIILILLISVTLAIVFNIGVLGIWSFL